MTQADLDAQQALSLQIRDKLTQTHDAITRIRSVRDQVTGAADRAKAGGKEDKVKDAAEALKKKLTAVEEALYQTKNQSNQDPLNYPIRLNNKLAALGGAVAMGDAAPTAQAGGLPGAGDAHRRGAQDPEGRAGHRPAGLQQAGERGGRARRVPAGHVQVALGRAGSRHHRHAGGPRRSPAGRTIEPFRIARAGRRRMGVVYLAEQEHPSAARSRSRSSSSAWTARRSRPASRPSGSRSPS